VVPTAPDGGSADRARSLAARIAGSIRGEARFDALTRTLFATDASIYQVTPLGAVFPRDAEDVTRLVELCREETVPIIPRGAGTGLTGGALGSGVVMDLSRYMTGCDAPDRSSMTVRAQPGVVLDELNAALAPHGLHFAPDVATSNRATIGGMIANNSCGARSIVHGRTCDHVASLDVVLSDGQLVRFPSDGGRAADIGHALTGIRDAYHPEIVMRFPRVARSNGGYGLDRLGAPGAPAPVVPLLCGSEGTLGIVVGATLKLTPLPEHRGIVLLAFPNVLAALEATPTVLALSPSAVELLDQLLLDAARRSPRATHNLELPGGNPRAVLIVEFQSDDPAVLSERMAACGVPGIPSRVITDAPGQRAIWDVRKEGLGLLMSRPGDEQPYSFVEDTAVAPARLRDYIERFDALLRAEQIPSASFYAHAGAGCIHVKPVLNLKRSDDVERMRRVAEAVCDLALEFGGTITGEHGDGMLRSCFLSRLYGPRIMEAFAEVKRLFDPHGLMNPGKIVDAPPMTEHLRFSPGPEPGRIRTHLDFSTHGGLAGLAGMCSGVGACRKRISGTMCPSYQATADEKDTTRARANALRVALSNPDLLHGIDDPRLAEVMDLCLACKACKTECPTGVDMAKIKYELLARRNLRDGVPRSDRFIASAPRWAALGSRFPRISNLLARSSWVRGLLEARYGLDRRVLPPRLAQRTFRSWFRGHRRSTAPRNAPRGRVVLFVDTWTNHYLPQVGVAGVRLLEAAGFEVLCPAVPCCGRPAISHGLLGEARLAAESNVALLDPYAREGVPIIGLEPSCILTLVDEYPDLLRTRAARCVSRAAVMIESFLGGLLRDDPGALPLPEDTRPILYHGHCHQKALVGTADAMALLRRAFTTGAGEINSGCCGMAGSFGHEVGHYEVARAIGAQRLFPAVRARGDALIAVSGFSCRQQIAHHVGVEARHVVELLADRLTHSAS
jgi:FAD/FMN-containing dehydrogenase/Fe-S oxidoreductase